MLEFFLWILWFFLLFRVISDLFRSHDIGGWGKAGWMILVILLPFFGVLIYVIVRGRGMAERDMAQAKQTDEAFKKYIRESAGSDADGTGGASHADELKKLADLKAAGQLSDEEFQRAKDKILA
jgi:hypothetical protein